MAYSPQTGLLKNTQVETGVFDPHGWKRGFCGLTVSVSRRSVTVECLGIHVFLSISLETVGTCRQTKTQLVVCRMALILMRWASVVSGELWVYR